MVESPSLCVYSVLLRGHTEGQQTNGPADEAENRDDEVVAEDSEGRPLYQTIVTPSGYMPSVFGQELSGPATHRTILPALAAVTADVADGVREGELFLVLAERFIEADPTNCVTLVAAADFENIVAVYRVPGNLLAPKTHR